MARSGGPSGRGHTLAGLEFSATMVTLCPMKLRLDLLEHLKMEDIAEEAEKATHRFKPEPLFSRTGVGSLSSASTQERAHEVAHSMDLTAKLTQRAAQTGKAPAAGK